MTSFEAIKKHLFSKQYTWLVTGVAGFIGSHLLEFLLAHKQKVIGLDNFSTGYRRNLDELGASVLFQLIEGDIRDSVICQQVCANVDFVLHEAALGSVPRSIDNPSATHEVNSTGFLNMLIAAKAAKVKRFVYASSSSVYGDSPTLPKVETDQGNLLSPYAVTKMTNELYAKAFGTCYGLETIGLRYFNVFGARQDPHGAYAAVIPLWFKALFNNEPVYINGDGSTSRDFCYIENVVQANLLSALTSDSSAVNTVYNVAFGKQTTLNQLYAMLCQLSGNTAHQPTYRDFRRGDIHHSLANIDKAKTKLAYQPTHSVQEGLSVVVKWYRECAC